VWSIRSGERAIWGNRCYCFDSKRARDISRASLRVSCLLVYLAGVEGLEPPAGGFGDRCSTKLSYTPTMSTIEIIGNLPPVCQRRVEFGRVRQTAKIQFAERSQRPFTQLFEHYLGFVSVQSCVGRFVTILTDEPCQDT
jgi:hypothetical protein